LRDLYVTPTNEVRLDAEYEAARPVLEQDQVNVIFAAMDSAGLLHRLVDTSGAITEASAATSLANLVALHSFLRYRTAETFGGAPGSGTNTEKAQQIPFQTTLTATAGGEITAANVGPPTQASYQAAMRLTHIYSDQTTANITFAIAPSAGAFTVGLTGMDISTVANTVSPDYNKGLVWLCGTDAATIQFACAAGQAGNLQSLTFCGVYWYET